MFDSVPEPDVVLVPWAAALDVPVPDVGPVAEFESAFGFVLAVEFATALRLVESKLVQLVVWLAADKGDKSAAEPHSLVVDIGNLE